MLTKEEVFLLTDVKLLEQVVGLIRKKTNKTFTTKIRVGFHDDKNFDDIIRCLDFCGVDGITIHGRTQELKCTKVLLNGSIFL